MKKLIIAVVLLFAVAITVTSCGASRKLGCPAVAQ